MQLREREGANFLRHWSLVAYSKAKVIWWKVTRRFPKYKYMFTPSSYFYISVLAIRPIFTICLSHIYVIGHSSHLELAYNCLIFCVMELPFRLIWNTISIGLSKGWLAWCKFLPEQKILLLILWNLEYTLVRI